MSMSYDAYVTAALFDRHGKAAFALGDGTVRFEGGETAAAHKGVALSACLHPSGEGVLTGGDDGAVVWSRARPTTSTTLPRCARASTATPIRRRPT